MKNSKTLSLRLREVFLEGDWIANTNYKAVLDDVDFELALVELASSNSIAALTFHINYYLVGVMDVLDGKPLLIRDKYSFFMPVIDSASAWLALKQTFYTNADHFALKVAQLSDDELNAIFVKEAYGSVKRNIEGILEHSYYHLGQIVLLRKLIREFGVCVL